jgi:hypothetical protein
MPLPFGCGAIPPGRTQRLLDSDGAPLSRKLSAGGPSSAAFTADGRGLAATAGLRRGVVPPGRPPRCYPDWLAGLPTGRMAFLLSGQERFTKDCFRFPVARALRPPILSDRPYRRTRRPEGFRLHSERIAPPLRKGSTLPRGRTAPHCGPFGQRWSRRLSALLQPGILPVRGIQPASPFGFTGRALCGRFPDLHRFAEWAFPSAQRLGQSCIPLKRIAGFGGFPGVIFQRQILNILFFSIPS